MKFPRVPTRGGASVVGLLCVLHFVPDLLLEKARNAALAIAPSLPEAFINRGNVYLA